VEFSLDGKSYVATRYKLREWLKLDAVRENVVDAIETKNIDGLAKSICTFVSIASSVSVDILLSLPWYDVVTAFLAVEAENKLRLDFALLRTTKKKPDDPAWEYEGRTWYWWNNILSSHYGWTSEYIAELDIDDATGLLQEIMVDEQLDREWQWSLTEIAYPYNETTKQSNFKPLDRPEWMMIVSSTNLPKIPIVRMRRDMLPVGFIVRGKSSETPIN
jgi:hypothetical protein